MVISQESNWDDAGTAPGAGNAKYVAGDQPIAEHDNYFNKSVCNDVGDIITALENVTTGHDHDGTDSKKIVQGSISPDATEAQTWDGSIDALINNLNRIRNQIVAITGEAWGTVSHTVAAIWGKFNATTGHKHTGAADDAPLIPAFTQMDNVTTSRALNTVYTNTSGKVMECMVGLALNCPNLNDSAYVSIDVAGVTIGQHGTFATPIAGIYWKAFVTFVVLVGATYKVQTAVAGAGSVVKSTWYEVT